MLQVADGVWLMPSRLPWVINTYLIATPDGDVLIDAGTRYISGLLLRGVRNRDLAMVALTHVHPDHQGAAHEICTRRKVPLACHEADADVMEGRAPMMPRSGPVRMLQRMFSGPPHPVAARWRGGEMIGDWRVVPTPGHTAGHVVFLRERDGVVIVGDVIRNARLRGGFGRISETPHIFSADPEENRRSMRRVLELAPKLLLFGHGPPSRDLAAVEVLVRRCEGR